MKNLFLLFLVLGGCLEQKLEASNLNLQDQYNEGVELRKQSKYIEAKSVLNMFPADSTTN
jgi:hypothetical protein